MGSVGSVGAWMSGWRGSNFGLSGVGNVGPYTFDVGEVGDMG